MLPSPHTTFVGANAHNYHVQCAELKIRQCHTWHHHVGIAIVTYAFARLSRTTFNSDVLIVASELFHHIAEDSTDCEAQRDYG